MTLKDLNVLYINNPINFSTEVDEMLGNVFNLTFDVSTFEESIRTFKDEFIDLLLIDIDYQEANGIKFLNIIKQKIPEFPVIILSAKEIKEVKKILDGVPVDNIMHIPVEPFDLSEKINQIEKKIIEIASSREDRKKGHEVQSPGVEESIDLYFKRFNEELRKAQKKRITKTMDFSIMKTFLFTAYNNFNDFDSNFDDNALKLAKSHLEKAMKLKRDLARKLSLTIEDNYEAIFLLQQAEYKKIHDEYEESIKKIQKLRDSLGYLAKELEEQKEALKKERKDTEAYENIDKTIKELNKKHVDRVHSIAEIKDKINKLDEDIEAYKEKYFEDFKIAFSNKTGQIKDGITESLNFAAYAFDKEIWRRAKQSKPVKHFFAESKIEGLFSSKTYLNYYTNGLDKDVVSEQNTKIIKYIKEFNKKNVINVAIIGNVPEKINDLKALIEKIDDSIKATGYLAYQRALEQHEQFNFEYILIDDRVQNITAIEIISKFSQKYKEYFSDIVFCIIMPSKIKNNIFHAAKKMGVTHFLNYEMNNTEFREKMLEIL